MLILKRFVTLLLILPSLNNLLSYIDYTHVLSSKGNLNGLLVLPKCPNIPFNPLSITTSMSKSPNLLLTSWLVNTILQKPSTLSGTSYTR